ncbi:MAG: zinc ribbon domain-containing protein [Ruminiclostridium sp.]|nr:zinc ribbon domain-containing protein [Ruminiclostridium sp.]
MIKQRNFFPENNTGGPDRFCNQCGSRLDDNARFCPKCGAVTDTGAMKSDAVSSALPVQPVQPVQAEPFRGQRVTRIYISVRTVYSVGYMSSE